MSRQNTARQGLLALFKRAMIASLLVALPLFAAPIVLDSAISKHAQVMQVNGIITHISVFNNSIFVGTANGGIEVFTLDKAKRAHKAYSLKLPYIKDYFNNNIEPRIFDIATFNGIDLFVLSEDSKGARQILKLSRNSQIESIYTTSSAPKNLIAFDNNKLILGFLSNEIALFDIESRRFIYETYITQAVFSDFVLNMPYIFSSDESGMVSVLNAYNGTILTRLDKINKDNNYQVASHKDIILTAGVDKKMAIYRFKMLDSSQFAKGDLANITFNLLESSFIKSSFLIYAVGIAKSGKRAAYSKNEQSDIAIIDIDSKSETHTLKGASSLINSLIFYDDSTLIAASDDRHFTIWHLP